MDATLAAAVVLWGVTAFTTVVTAIPFLRTGLWWVRIWDFPRIALSLLALLALGGWWLLGIDGSAARWSAVAALVGAAVAQIVQMIPYSPLGRRESLPAGENRSADAVRLLTANVLMTNRQYGRMLELVRRTDPDILLLVEPDRKWAAALTDLHQRYDWRVEEPLDSTYGMLLFSRLELRDARVRRLVEDYIPSIHAKVVLPGGADFDLHCLHPKPPRYQQHSLDRDAELMTIGGEVADCGRPAVVVGDLNDVAWSHTTRLFRRISRLLDPRRGRGLYSTFPAKGPFLLRVPLDHIFHSEEFRLAGLETLGPFGSDHLAILTTLCYEPQRSDGHEAPKEGAEDQREVEEIKAAERKDEPSL